MTVIVVISVTVEKNVTVEYPSSVVVPEHSPEVVFTTSVSKGGHCDGRESVGADSPIPVVELKSSEVEIWVLVEEVDDVGLEVEFAVDCEVILEEFEYSCLRASCSVLQSAPVRPFVDKKLHTKIVDGKSRDALYQ